MNDFDPQAPFTGSDGLVYACVADKILAQPFGCWRNENILHARRQGVEEKLVRRWLEAYDEAGGTPDCTTRAGVNAHIRANYAVSRDGTGLDRIADDYTSSRPPA